MNYVLLYFLAGAIVAVWTLINNLDTEPEGKPGRRLRSLDLIAACIMSRIRSAQEFRFRLPHFAIYCLVIMTSGCGNEMP